MEEEEGAFVVEEVTLSESDGDYDYKSVALDSEAPDLQMDEDYETLTTNVQPAPELSETFQSKVTYRHESTDDFVRNFLVRLGMTKTVETFQAEWYELRAKGKLKIEDTAPVPDVYLKNQELRDQVCSMRAELEKAQYDAQRARNTWDKLRREKEFHRMHHHRTQQEKQKLVGDIERLKKAHEQYVIFYRVDELVINLT